MSAFVLVSGGKTGEEGGQAGGADRHGERADRRRERADRRRASVPVHECTAAQVSARCVHCLSCICFACVLVCREMFLAIKT